MSLAAEQKYNAVILFFGSGADCVINAATMKNQKPPTISEKHTLGLDKPRKKLKIIEIRDVSECKYNLLFDFLEEGGCEGIAFSRYNSDDDESREESLNALLDELKSTGLSENHQEPSCLLINTSMINKILFGDTRPSCYDCSSLNNCSEGKEGLVLS